MVFPRWKKVFADLWSNKVRTLLVVLSIAVGVFAVGGVASIYLILKDDVTADYLSTHPHTATLYTDFFDDNLLYNLRKTSGVVAIEGRSTVTAKLKGAGDKSYPIYIHRYPALKDSRIDLLRLEQGAPELHDHEIYIERQVASSLGYRLGDVVTVTLDSGKTRDLRIAGIVHAVESNGFYFNLVADAFTNAGTLEWLGGPPQFNEMVISVSDLAIDEAHVHAVANAVAEKLQEAGARSIPRSSITLASIQPSRPSTPSCH